MPAVIPETIPEVRLTTATVVLLLVQVPPATASLKVIDKPWQTLAGPVIATGVGLTVTVVIAIHPSV